jgi:hypothetical protein
MWIGYPHMPTGAEGVLLFEKLVAFAKKTSNIAD